MKREHICLNQGQGQYLRELWRGQDGPHCSGGSPPSPPLLPLAWVGGQWVAPGHWQGSPGELIAHLPHAPNTRVTRDVWQLQLGQLLLQDRDPLLMGCRDTGRVSLPPLPQDPPAVPAPNTACLQLPETPQGWFPSAGAPSGCGVGGRQVQQGKPWTMVHLAPLSEDVPVLPQDPALLTGYLAPHLCHQHICEERNQKQNPP